MYTDEQLNQLQLPLEYGEDDVFSMGKIAQFCATARKEFSKSVDEILGKELSSKIFSTVIQGTPVIVFDYQVLKEEGVRSFIDTLIKSGDHLYESFKPHAFYKAYSSLDEKCQFESAIVKLLRK